jgi:hypothetical protein
MKIYADELISNKVLIDGDWVVARPIPYQSLLQRLVEAIDVIRGNALAVYFYEQSKPKKSIRSISVEEFEKVQRVGTAAYENLEKALNTGSLTGNLQKEIKNTLISLAAWGMHP